MADGAEQPGTVDHGIEVVGAHGDLHRFDLIRLPETPTATLDPQPITQGVSQLIDQHLQQDVHVGEVGTQ
jgi:hypothetical protein